MTEIEFKDAIRARDGYRCTECGMTQEDHLKVYRRRLHIHRNKPGRAGGQYVAENSRAVCIPCHAQLEKALRGKRRPVSLPADVVQVARSLAPLYGQKPADFLADLLRPLLRDKIEEGKQLMRERWGVNI
jgi:hypothetical protein